MWLEWSNPAHARLINDGKQVGQLWIDAPSGASGFGIDLNPLSCPTWMGAAPVIGATGIGPHPVGRLDLHFRAGSAPGRYTTTVSLNNGNSVEMVVIAE